MKDSIEAYFVYFSENTALVTLHLSDGIYKNEPAAQQKVLKIMDDLRDHYKDLIDQARSNSLINTELDSDSLSTVILGTLRLYVTRWSLDGHRYDVKNDAQIVFNIIESILKKV